MPPASWFALIGFGSWSDAVGRRPVLLAGILVALASSVVFLIADSVPLLLVGRLLSGLSAGAFTGTATAAVIEAAPQHWRNRAATVATIANVAGLGGGPLLAGLLVQYAPHPLHLAFIVHTGLLVLATAALLVVPETSPRTGRIGLQRLSVPEEVRGVFVVAAIAAFACFAITGLFTSVAPAFVSNVVGIDNHAVAGAVASTILIASAVAQVFAGRIPAQRAVVLGCAILIVGMVILAVALELSSLLGLIAAAIVAGIGQGIAFSRGLAAVAERTPDDRRAEVSSTYFVVAYVAISLPVIGEGLAAQHWGLRTAGVSFAIAVGDSRGRMPGRHHGAREPEGYRGHNLSASTQIRTPCSRLDLRHDRCCHVPQPGRGGGKHPRDAGPCHRRHPNRVVGRRGRRAHDHGDERHPRRRVHLEQPAHRIRHLPGVDLGFPDHAAVLLRRRRGLRRLSPASGRCPQASRRKLGQLADAPLHPAVPAGVLLPGVLDLRAGDTALLPA